MKKLHPVSFNVKFSCILTHPSQTLKAMRLFLLRSIYALSGLLGSVWLSL
ncbi:MAG: bis-aminopropyl spermidine synthase family protein [Prevotella sp.]|nr:bis-aminopropyl spermidine synthase family protein [Prevotella sp.]MBQ2496999.1 bis-aminopropyl spermidine synthase family protein [Prevotella sp.]MBQ2589587.1 bis-aminopropyl spermidine synthase family protein [Prevotella sp.]MBQ4175351.1 bis-aminopropyl spermidine synthase family protein [Prevotella sp.]